MEYMYWRRTLRSKVVELGIAMTMERTRKHILSFEKELGKAFLVLGLRSGVHGVWFRLHDLRM